MRTRNCRNWTSVLLVATAAMVCSLWFAASASAVVITGFDEATLDPNVSLDVPNDSLGNITHDTTNNELDFNAFAGTDMWGARNNAPIAWTSSPTVSNGQTWSAETEVRLNSIVENGQVAGITFYGGPDGARPDFTFGLDNWNPANRMVKLQGLADNNPLSDVTWAGSSALLRVEVTENGDTDTYNFFYKADAADDWTQLLGAGLDFQSDFDNSRAGLFYKTNIAKEGAAFAYFNVPDVIPPEVLTWDGSAGQWGEVVAGTSHWLNGTPDQVPDDTIVAEINGGLATVEATHAARSLTVGGGGLAIDAGRSLTIGWDATFAADTTLDIGAGATLDVDGVLTVATGVTVPLGADAVLAADRGSIDALTTAGNATLDVGRSMSVTTLTTTAAGILIKQGDGILILDNVSGTGVVAADTVFRVEAGTLQSAGVDPLGGSRSITLAGGTLSLTGRSDLPVTSAIATDGMIEDLNADVGVVTDAAGVSLWENQAPSGGDDVAQVDDNLKPTLNVGLLNGHNTIGLAEDDGGAGDRMHGDQRDAFNGLIDGSGHTWFVVTKAGDQTDTDQNNRFFGTLTEADYSAGWTGICPGLRSNGTPYNVTRAGGYDFANSANAINDDEFHIVAGRLGAGLGSMLEEVFSDGPSATGSVMATVNAGVNSDLLSVGVERLTGAEDYVGEIARILIYDRPLTDVELAQTGLALQQTYGIDASFNTLAVFEPLDRTDTDLLVIADSTLEVNPGGSFGTLTMVGGALTTAGTGPIQFAATTIDPGATAVGFDPQVETNYGGIDANSAPVTISKAGTGTWVLETSPTNLENADWRVEGGTLELAGTNALGGRPITVAGGTLSSTGAAPLGDTTMVDLAGGTFAVNTVPTLQTWDFESGDMTGWNIVATAHGDNAVFTTVGNQPAVQPHSGTFDAATIQGDYWIRTWEGEVLGTGDGPTGIVQTDPFVLGDGAQFDLLIGGGNHPFRGDPDSPQVDMTSLNLERLVGADDWEKIFSANGANQNSLSPVHWNAAAYAGDTVRLRIYDTASGGWGHVDVDNIVFSAADDVDMSGTDLRLQADSTVSANPGAAFGQLTINGGSLTTAGATRISFAATTIDPDAGVGEVGFVTEVTTDPGVITADGVTPLDVTKAGSGDLVLDKQNIGLDAATFNVTEGRLIALGGADPLGAAALRLGGGELVLAGKTPGADVTFDNAVTVEASSTITAGADGLGAAGPLTVTLGSATNGVTVHGGTLTLQTADDYRLRVAGDLSGGELSITDSHVTLAGADNAVATMKLSGGTVSTGDGTVVIGDNLRIEDVSYSIEAGTFAVGSSDMASGGEFTLSGGTLTVAVPGAPTGAIAYWPFDETTGAATLPDLSGSPTVYDGTIVGESVFAEGQIGNAMHFDGVGDWVELPEGFDDFTGGVTIAAFAKPEALLHWARIVDFSNGPGVDNVLLARITTTLGVRFEVRTGDGAGAGFIQDTSDVMELDEWQHLAVTLDESGNAVIYKNGEPVVSGSMWMPRDLLRTINYIGKSAWDGDGLYEGLMDELYIYDRGLTAEEVGELYGGGDGPQPTPLDLPGTSFAVTVDSTLHLDTYQDATLGNLELDAGVNLEITGAAASFNDVTGGDGASIEADAVVVRGVLSPGDGIGTLSIDAELEFDEDATYAAELDGSGADLVVVTADVYPAGTLSVQAIGPLGDLTQGGWGDQTRAVMQVVGGEPAFAGPFDSEPAAGDHLGHGVFHKQVIYNETSIEVSVLQAAPGDVNGDNEVNNADLQGILGAGSFNNPGQWDWTQGDFNGDGLVGNTDLQLILATGLFGTGAYAAEGDIDGGMTVVPEPGTLLLLAGGMLGLLLWRRRRCSCCAA